MKIIIKKIKSTPLFYNINPEEIESLMKCLRMNVTGYNKDSFICFEGDKADFIGIVLEGTVQVIREDYDGRRIVMSAIGKGGMFAEAFACADIEFMPVSILAVTDCEILFIKKNDILSQCPNACSFHTDLVRNLLKIVALKNMNLNNKLHYVSQKTTAEKLMAFLRDYAKQCGSDEFTIPYDRQALADYLGVERTAMSTEISKLKKQGIIETNRSYFKIKN